jgi:hypothetical protein
MPVKDAVDRLRPLGLVMRALLCDGDIYQREMTRIIRQPRDLAERKAGRS